MLEVVKPGVKKAVIPSIIIAVINLPTNCGNLFFFISTSYNFINLSIS